MKPFTWLVLTGTVFATTACSVGGDVYIETDKSEAKCTLAPQEDVCAHHWNEVPSADRTRVVTFLGHVAVFAGLASEVLVGLDETCTQMLTEGGAAVPSVAPGATTSSRADSRCQAAIAMISERKPSSGSFPFVLVAGASTCSAVPLPECVFASSDTRVTCAASSVEVSPAEGASAADVSFGRVVARGLWRVLQVRAQLERLASVSSEISARSDVAVPECLIPTTISLSSQAASDVRLAASLSGSISAAIDAR
jgi:hypothetical protein